MKAGLTITEMAAVDKARFAKVLGTMAEQRYLDSARIGSANLYSELETQLLFHDLMAGASEEQHRLALLRLRGCSLAEAAQVQGMGVNRARRLLKELRQDYLLRPLAVGAKAVILHQGQVTYTSRVVNIHSRTEDEIRFETLNTEYRLLTGPDREQAADSFPMAMAA